MARKFFGKLLPAAETVRKNRFLRRLGPRLAHPELWHVSRRGIACGLAIGVFMGLLIPIAQIPFAAVAAVILRANLPIAVASTLVTNPFTFAPIYFLAYRIGSALVGNDDVIVTEESLETDAENVTGWFTFWVDKMAELGAPLAVGLLVLASTGAAIAYVGVMMFWRVQVALRWRRRGR
jgi:uncharacterized protein